MRILILLIATALIAPLHAEERPNILFAFADDWGRYASAYAAVEKKPGPNSLLKTPNFDRVAKEGVLFTHAYVNAPSCTPCRSSLLSGQYFWRTGRGAILQGAVWDPKIPTFPLLLRDAGYHIGQTYKVWSPGTPRDAPFGEKQYEYEKAGSRFNGFSQGVTAMVKKGRTVEEAKQVLYDEVAANFDAFMAAREKGKPFLYWFGPTNVHRKWIKGSGKDLWDLNPDDLKGKLPEFLPDVHDVRQDMADYLGEVMAFDAALGLLMKKLEEKGELDNTLIVVSGDHGAPGFPRGKTNLYDFGTNVSLAIRWPGGKVKGGRVVEDFVNLTDLAPTLCEAGGIKPADVMTGRSLIGILNSEKQGVVSEDRKFVVTGRERHVAAVREGNLPYPQRAIRTDDFLYVRNFKPDRWPEGAPFKITDDSAPPRQQLENNTFVTFGDLDASPTKAWLIENRKKAKKYYDWAFAKRPEEELYDLTKDPDQVRNVAGEKVYADVKRELSAKLMKILKETGDPRVKGDGSTFDKPPFTGGKPLRRKK